MTSIGDALDAFAAYVEHVLFVALITGKIEDVKPFLYSLSILVGVNRALATRIRNQRDSVWLDIIAAWCRYDPHTDGTGEEVYNKAIAKLGFRHMLVTIMDSKPGCSKRQLCFGIAYTNLVVRESPVTVIGGSTLLTDGDKRSSIIPVGNAWTGMELPDVLPVLMTDLAQSMGGQLVGPQFVADIQEIGFGSVHVNLVHELNIEYLFDTLDDRVITVRFTDTNFTWNGDIFGRTWGETLHRRFAGLIGDTFTYTAVFQPSLDAHLDDRVVISQTYEIGVSMPGCCFLGPRFGSTHIESMDSKMQTLNIVDTPDIFTVIDMAYTILNAGAQGIQ
jgi:hypothetical protein